MSRNGQQPAKNSTEHLRTAFLGALLGTISLALFLVQPFATLFIGYDFNKVLRSISVAEMLQGAIALQIIGYAAALLVTHIFLGIVAAAFAIAWTVAYPTLTRLTRQLVALWLVALLAWVITTNAIKFPMSNASAYYAAYLQASLAGLRLPHLIGALICLAMLPPVAVLTARVWRRRRIRVRAAMAASGILALAGITAGLTSGAVPGTGSHQHKPNVILIGLDSLRLDVLSEFGGSGQTPNIDEFTHQSAIFLDSTTPLSRTFPAWVSILTGQHPRTTGAVANLVNRDTVDTSQTLGRLLEGQGYRTVMATDEVRFSNIDQSYGFDQLITPRIGASDFLLGTLNDLPLPNLVSLTIIGKWLFPNSYANRATASTYYPDIFLNRLRTEIETRGPTFIAIHLAAAHYPYYTANTRQPPPNMQDSEMMFWYYNQGIQTLDQMFGVVMNILSEKGLLNNALVVVLSDHGEALRQPRDRLLDPADSANYGAMRQIEVPNLGHGTSVLSPVQYQVLLATRRYGAAAPQSWPTTGRYNVPVSLEDIAPSILDALDVPATMLRFDGRSLLTANDANTDWSGRVRFTETDFNIPLVLAGEMNPGAVAAQGAEFYAIEPTSGWLHLKPSLMPEVLKLKERAAIQGHWILAALPTLGAGTRYLMIHRETGEGRILSDAPLPSEVPAGPLWAALHDRFPGELGPPSQ